ncbi:hypothetical protein [Nonomuraea sp. NPDC046570]|uniref:hypothetical protein n=1 Tax=Nonomuraea sp. NPDC046570 TaxID=3155255 RepID=UPI0033FF3A32
MGLDLPGGGQGLLERGADLEAGGDLLAEDLVAADAVRGQGGLDVTSRTGVTFDLIGVTGDVVGDNGIGDGYGANSGLRTSTTPRILSQTFLRTASIGNLSENQL